MVDNSIPFDYRQMHQYLNEIGTYLAELHYIDQVFAYMDEAESSWWETAVDGVLSAGTSSGDTIVVDFVGTVSFKRTWRLPQTLPLRLPWQDSFEEEVRGRIEKYKTEASEWASSNMDSIKSMTKPLAHPTGSVYLNDLIQPSRDALARLEDFVTHDFGKLRQSLGHWSGEAADDFATNFYNPFEHTLASHQRMITALVTGLEGAHTIVDLTQQSLMNVLHKTRDALLEQLHRRAQQAAAMQKQAQEQSIKNAMIIVSAVIPIFKKQELWDTRLDLAGVAASAAAGAASAGAMEEHALTGGTAEELLLSLGKAIQLIEDNADHQYRDLDEKVSAVLSRMDLIRNTPSGEDGRLIPPQPRLIDGTNSSDFYLPDAR
ncbi:hypothetical protein AAH979_20770 [Plantactinospora sp. ZYX-F-223]|uniref:hypothetical protein n=1 Tax=Plantactinospora sp. ZYX-F-223 TaxID=3144103 RepID=UPI0031FBB4AB